MSVSTSAITVDPLLRPRQVIARLDDAGSAEAQRAAAEGRLEPTTVYSTEEPTTRASLTQSFSGALGFVTGLIALPVALLNTTARAHGGFIQAEGGVFGLMLLCNVLAGFGAVAAHDALHAAAVRLLGGEAALVTTTTPLTYAWSAPAQGFRRRSLVFALLFPLVVLTALWLIALVAVPVVALFTIAGVVASSATAGMDLWVARAVLREPERAAVFVARPDGYIAYAVTASKVARKKITPTKGSPAK